MDGLITALSQVSAGHVKTYLAIIRFLIPVLAGLLLYLCGKPLLTFRREPEIWAWLILPNGDKLPITHWENIVGRSKHCDIVVDFPSVSRNHAVLTRYDDGSWTVTNISSKDTLLVNGESVKISALEPGDVITIGGLDMHLEPISQIQEVRLAQLRTKASTPKQSALTLLLLSFIQVLLCLAFLLGGNPKYGMYVIEGFGGVFLCQWLLLGFYLCTKRSSFEVETIAFLLCSMGMAVICTVIPYETVKQLIAMIGGLILYMCIAWSLRDLERAKVVRYLATIGGVGLLVITLLFGTEFFGAKNWIMIGSLSIQPSELSKVCFVYVGASTMDHIVQKRNLLLFIGYSAIICGFLAVMNDFGTALIFFCAFLVISYLRSGNVGLVGLAIASLAFAGVIVLKIAPHALQRFATWRHIWEDPLNTGYQQTQGLMCVAAGGLFGLGAGQGLAKYIFASASDMVFVTVSEEWGLILATMMTLTVIILALFAVRSASVGRSSFHTIAGCTAASILMMQTILNVLGSLDVVPLTGVTFPFLSNGGSGMISAWGLLAFIKAADTRQNASFAIRLPNLGEVKQ